jgi:hypothetical protein
VFACFSLHGALRKGAQNAFADRCSFPRVAVCTVLTLSSHCFADSRALMLDPAVAHGMR